LLGYCLMSNHVHLIVVPHRSESLAHALRHAHGRYAAYWNARRFSTGHVWQGRFYSCPMEEGHLWEALRYVELNPVRAGMVESAAHWKWSSAAAHCGAALADAMLEMERWRKRWTAPEWARYLEQGESAPDLNALRRATHTGRPLGTTEFVAELEKVTMRPLAPQKGGRPKKAARDGRQLDLLASG
jgi:putative transposase